MRNEPTKRKALPKAFKEKGEERNRGEGQSHRAVDVTADVTVADVADIVDIDGGLVD